MIERYGALPEEWDHLSLGLGLTEDLLPVVSNPNAEISPDSKMKDLGKTPSRYNKYRKVAGIAGWTQQKSTQVQIEGWRKEKDYGICIQTRYVRAIDIDIEDPNLSREVQHTVVRLLGALPKRFRSNSSKVLFAFTILGEMPKRIIRVPDGIIEFLATGQQFIAAGTHPSGARYEWEGGLPDTLVPVGPGQFEELWQALEDKFAVEPSSTSKSSTKPQKLNAAIENDPIAQYLLEQGHVKSTERDGRLHIVCPFEDEHSGPSSDSATTYFPANTGGYVHGHFDCKHAHCEHRTDEEFKDAMGIPIDNPMDDFDDLSHNDGNAAEPNLSAPNSGKTVDKKRFEVIPAADFVDAPPQEWLIKGVLPQAALGVVYGESASGKTFLALDMVGAIALGNQWRERNVKKGKVVYICAEGAGGFRGRLRALATHTNARLTDLDIGVIPDAPNFMHAPDIKAVLAAIQEFGPISVIVVDTFAQVMSGANENAGEDVGKALKHCRVLHKHTGSLVILIHHSGKDSSKGARGWSGLRAAADVEIEIIRAGDDRVATVTKLKDGIDGTEFGFKLHTIPIGMDEDDEVISSCVIEHTEGSRAKAAQKKQIKGMDEALAFDVFNELAGLTGVVEYHELLEGITRQIPFDELSGKKDPRNRRASVAVEKLRASGQLCVDGGKITLPKGE